MTQIERRARPLLGTFVEIRLRNGTEAVFAEAFGRIEAIQRLMSAHFADSDLGNIGRSGHRHAVTVDPATAEVIRFSLALAEASDGAFDPVRAGVALVLGGRRPWFGIAMPDPAATWRDLSLDGLEVRAINPLALDLGGVAKGYAVDVAAEIIEASGFSGVVNAGGDLRFIGGEERTAFIPKPDVEGDGVELREIPFPALATTGSYHFSAGGGNADLIGATAGAQLPSGISITVFAESCMVADAWTKVVLNLPRDQAAALLKASGCTALVLESGGRIRELP